MAAELFSCGYIPNKDIWTYAEKGNGSTLKFLKETSKAFKIYFGAGLIEIIDGEYRNTYLENEEGMVISKLIIEKREPVHLEIPNYDE